MSFGVGVFFPSVIALALPVFAAWIVAWWVGSIAGLRAPRSAADVVLDALIAGLVSARVAFVIWWWSDYFKSPMSMLAIGDGGFNWWFGVSVAAIWALWKSRSQNAVRAAAFAGIGAGLLSWAATSGALSVYQTSRIELPQVGLQTLDDRTAMLESFRGKPVVVNLWASWCPPCRREMPMLEDAQSRYPGVTFVLANQGEAASTVSQFMASTGLQFHNVLLDRESSLMQAAKSRGLPTTLIFDRNGRLVDSHLGELTRAGLGRILADHELPNQSKTQEKE